jgi:hypothetical protein
MMPNDLTTRPVPHITPLYEEWSIEAIGDLIDRSLPTSPTHKVARCRWCGSEFVFVFMFTRNETHVREAMQTPGHWLCRRPVCAARQLRWAIPDRRETRDERASPWIYVPTPSAAEVQESGNKNVLIGGAAGGSKSHGVRWNNYWWQEKIPGYKTLLVRQTFGELESTHLLRMENIDQFLFPDARYIAKSRSMVFERGDGLVKAGHCNNPSDVGQYLSQEWDEIDIDEASLLQRDVLTGLSSRARSDQATPEVRARGGGWVRLATNPGGPAALYIEEFYITRKVNLRKHKKYHPEHYSFVYAAVEDNPYLEEDYIETRLDPLSPERYEQLRHGKWGTFSGQFFPSFDASTHIQAVNP